MKVALIQMNAGQDKAANLAKAQRLIEQACIEERPDLVVLPECFTLYGGDAQAQRDAAEPCPGGEAYTMLQKLAAQNKTYIHGGSINERDSEAIFNTSFIFDREGREVARYRKIHLFAITAPDGTVYDEGKIYGAGNEIVTFDLDGIRVGCTICYDLRFPELFRALADAGCQVIAVPAAFTLQTGKEHWEPLLRARAIESQCFILAPGQEGAYEEGGQTLYNYGHSLVVEPWGTVIARRSLGDGIVAAMLEIGAVETARRRIPLAQHRRLPFVRQA